MSTSIQYQVAYRVYVGMKLTTTFWSKEIHTFDTLLYINSSTNEILYQTDLNSLFDTYVFFKQIAQFVKSDKVRKTFFKDNSQCYQFAVHKDNEIVPIKWFDLIVSDNLTISHDIAFETTLIKKNGQRVGFGRFPMYYWKRNITLPKYRELNIKARTYKYIANQIKNAW